MADVNGLTIQRKNMTTHKKPTRRVVPAGAEFQGKQGHMLAPGISARPVGSRRIHLQIARIPRAYNQMCTSTPITKPPSMYSVGNPECGSGGVRHPAIETFSMR